MIEDYPEYIITHRTNQEGEIQYFVKWLGFDDLDNTWETEHKLQTEWPFVLTKYRQNMNINYTPKKPLKKEIDKVFDYTNSVKDWEMEVESITYVEKTKLSGLMIYVKWKNGMKSIHHSSEIYSKCPQKMIDYFEKHRKFKPILDRKK